MGNLKLDFEFEDARRRRIKDRKACRSG